MCMEINCKLYNLRKCISTKLLTSSCELFLQKKKKVYKEDGYKLFKIEDTV